MSTLNANSISVIIPAYNAEHFLHKALSSVFGQTIKPAEVIVIDDGSTDSTHQIAKSFGMGTICLRQANAGPAAARNRGMREAQGDLIALLDADDRWVPDFLEKTQAFLSVHATCVAVSVGLCFARPNQMPLHVPPSAGTPKEPFIIESFFEYWGKNNHIRTGSCVFRRRDAEEVGWQREDLRCAEDLEFWGMLATQGNWGFIPEPLWICESMMDSEGALFTKRIERSRHAVLPEDWARRILPRLRDIDRQDFDLITARIALMMLYGMIMVGRRAEAREVFRDWESGFPRNRLVFLLGCASRAGRCSWFSACQLLRLREWLFRNLFWV